MIGWWANNIKSVSGGRMAWPIVEDEVLAIVDVLVGGGSKSREGQVVG